MSAIAQTSGPVGSAGTRRPRVLYFIIRYPEFSETYMHEEMRSVRSEYETLVVTCKQSKQPRREAFPYQWVEYEDSDLVYGNFERVDPDFGSPRQKAFLEKVDAIVRSFQPDILHAHYFGLTLLLRKLSEMYGLPYTVRTHSMDTLSEPENKLRALCAAANDPRCAQIYAYPASRDRLLEFGLDPRKVTACWPVVNFARFHKPALRPRTNRVMCAGPSIRKKAHDQFLHLAARMRGSGLGFDLYGEGPMIPALRELNQALGGVVDITYADPDDMPDVYPRYDWIVYPSNTEINKVGLPVAVCEAQASGLGVCLPELPGRREEQLEFLGGGGFLFRSIDEVPAILARPYPEDMRLAGLENAAKFDIERHKQLLTGAWAASLRRADSPGQPVTRR